MLTIVIPSLNEEASLAEVLPNLFVEGVGEVIVVDGGSQDQSVRVARQCGARVLLSAPGRGSQQALGAKAAKGDLILFLHADTILPEGFLTEVNEVIGQPGVVAGAFRLRIGAPGTSVRMIEFLANLRSRFLNSPYGDQAIFLRRQTLEAIGGVPEIPLLEDVRLIKMLKHEGRIGLSKKSVLTSGRAWTGHGTIRTTAANLTTNVGYALGVNPVRLAVWRRKLLPVAPTISS